MPTYEYECKSCGEHLEAKQSFTDPPLTDCPTCGGPLRKVFGTIGISFKGSGFYRTDSRGGARTKDRETDKEGSKAPASSDAASSTSGSPTSGSPTSGSPAPSSPAPSSPAPSSPAGSGPSKPSSSDGAGSGSGSSAPTAAAAAG